jgi:prepilin-type N-terminal cleavage/methylation domain-containing protein
MQKQSGLTFIELMIVLGVLAILSGLAVPAIFSWLPNHRLGGAARDVLSLVERARLTAVRDNGNATVNFQLGGAQCTASVNGTTFGDETLPGDVRFSGVTFTGQTLQFDGQGMPSEGGTITLSNRQGATRSIVVSFGGNASIQ